MYNLFLNISLTNIAMVDYEQMLSEVVHFVVLPTTPKYAYVCVCFFISEPVMAYYSRFRYFQFYIGLDISEGHRVICSHGDWEL